MEQETLIPPIKRKRGRPRKVVLAVTPLPAPKENHPPPLEPELEKWNREHPHHKGDKLIRIIEPKSIQPRSSKRTNRNRGIDNQLAQAIKRVRYSVEGFGPSSAEILKIAALQVVQTKLDEIGQLLKAIVPDFQPRLVGAGRIPPFPPSSPASRPLTLENIDRLDRQMLGIQSDGKPPCELCGQPWSYTTKRGANYCIGHRAQGIKDDQDDKLQSMMRMGFGKSATSDDIISVDDETIKAALAAQEGENQ